jgi:hypothetical protein
MDSAEASVFCPCCFSFPSGVKTRIVVRKVEHLATVLPGGRQPTKTNGQTVRASISSCVYIAGNSEADRERSRERERERETERARAREKEKEREGERHFEHNSFIRE